MLRWITKPIVRRLGRRGICLTVLGVLFCLIGLGDILGAEDFKRLPAIALAAIRLALEIMPIVAWGWAFIVVGLLACISAWYPPGRDAIGFGTITAFSIFWAVVYCAGWLLYGSPRAWLGALDFLAVGFLAQVISGWPDDEART